MMEAGVCVGVCVCVCVCVHRVSWRIWLFSVECPFVCVSVTVRFRQRVPSIFSVIHGWIVMQFNVRVGSDGFSGHALQDPTVLIIHTHTCV